MNSDARSPETGRESQRPRDGNERCYHLPGCFRADLARTSSCRWWIWKYRARTSWWGSIVHGKWIVPRISPRPRDYSSGAEQFDTFVGGKRASRISQPRNSRFAKLAHGGGWFIARLIAASQTVALSQQRDLLTAGKLTATIVGMKWNSTCVPEHRSRYARHSECNSVREKENTRYTLSHYTAYSNMPDIWIENEMTTRIPDEIARQLE